MFALLFALGTIPFWIMTAVVCGIMIALVESEREVFAASTVIAFFAALALFGDFNIVKIARENPLRMVEAAGLYFFCGAVWSVSKFWLYGNDWRRKYRDLRRAFYERNGIVGNPSEVPVALRDKWECDFTRQQHTHKAPVASNMMGRISAWMVYWPFSFLWFIVHDPVRRIFREIRIFLWRVYERIGEHFMTEATNDLKHKPTIRHADPDSE